MASSGKTLFEKSIVRTMKMDDDVWQRHASPWSIWTRFTCLPLIALSIWSRVWIGEWCLAPLTLSLIWTWYNPRAFSPPANFDNWGSKATFGERVWLNRPAVPIPNHHQIAAHVTSALAAPGLLAMAYGLYTLSVWPTCLGLFSCILAKVWFCDRMVWLYEDMRKTNAVYASWMQTPGNDNLSKEAA